MRHIPSPRRIDILREMGIAYFKAGKSKAVPYLGEASVAIPEMFRPCFTLRAYEAQAGKTEAIAIFKEIEQKTVDDEEVLYDGDDLRAEQPSV